MIRGLAGSLISAEALERVIPDALRGLLGEGNRAAARRDLRAWHLPLRDELGPSSSPRRLLDRLALPLMARLGYRAAPVAGDPSCHRLALRSAGHPVAALVVTAWGREISGAWRETVLPGLGLGIRWCFCLSGPSLRVFDAGRTYTRRYLELDLALALDDERAFGVLWGLLRAEAMRGPGGGPPLLDRAVTLSERHRAAVRVSLQAGVHAALGHLRGALAAALRHRSRARPPDTADLRHESLVVVYRLLFLLFAEARGLVPVWHPLYREAYTIEALRGDVEQLARPAGLWEALQAIARLAHRGCRAGTLTVTPFNGPLFSPAQAPLAEALSLDDGAVRSAVLALTTRTTRQGRERIAYGDLDVEQLGGVYERLLDAPAIAGRAGVRRETGSFYTPRALTDTLVRRTLAPLIDGATPDAILSLRVVDPAMGSGAFLVSACRYLARAYEASLIAAGGVSADDIGEADRTAFRRQIAQRCLFGVDANPVAVHLGRLSLWLATLAADRPLTFLDHHLRAGDSLVGATPEEVLRRPPPGGRAAGRPATLPLFGLEALDGALGSASAVRLAVATEPGDTLDQVRRKEQALADLAASGGAVAAWMQVADLWCSGWFRDAADRRRFRAVFDALVASILNRRSPLPAHLRAPFLAEAAAIAGRRGFFHWTLEFPEVFVDAGGRPRPDAGFDAVLCNPPWETLRGARGGPDTGDPAGATDRRTAAQVVEFARTSGVYVRQGDGHANLYQLFTERAVALLRHGGRLGLVVPSGLAIDHGCAGLRRALLDDVRLDTLAGIDNRAGLFPIHRGLRFLLLTGRKGEPTPALVVRSGIQRADTLGTIPDRGADPAGVPLTRAFLQAFSGDALVLPDVRSAADRDIASRLLHAAPRLGDRDGWHVSFGRELNATDDRQRFSTGRRGIPVLEGKHLSPFRVDAHAVRYRIPVRAAGRLSARLRYLSPRLAYRDVASASNRVTLIAAVVPAGMLTTHTVFCLREDVEEPVQHYLCGVLNSFVANFLVRLQVGTHVTTGVLARLPVPVVPRASAAFLEIADLARALSRPPDDPALALRLQVAVAALYRLDPPSLRHIVSTFPLVDGGFRDSVCAAFTI